MLGRGPCGGSGGVAVVMMMMMMTMLVTMLALMPGQCEGSSDPRARLCDPICWEEEALSDQCVEDRCSGHRVRSRAYRRCANRCWDIVAPCRQLCHNKAFEVLDLCDGTCSPKAHHQAEGETTTTMQPGCHMDCFTHNMMLIKTRELPPNEQNTMPVSPAS